MSRSPFLAIDHIQLAMPAGGEETARGFFVDLCGMTEIPKPTELAKRGGCWFRSGAVEIHLGVEQDFRPALKAHPALVCASYDVLIARFKAANVSVKEDFEIPGTRRSHIFDPFGNRIELIANAD
jgi:catechol 2,3-dioxygenase-like lactoylglutathione lyase family enzyme